MVDENAEAPHLLAALDGLQQHIRAGLADRLRAHGETLRGSEARILHLIGPDGARPTALADGAWISKQAIGKRVREMERRGLVETGPDPADGRAVIVRRTPEGERVRAFTLAQIAAVERELAEAVGPDRYEVFRSVLGELAAG